MNTEVLYGSEMIPRLLPGNTFWGVGHSQPCNQAPILHLRRVSSCKLCLLFHLDPGREDWFSALDVRPQNYTRYGAGCSYLVLGTGASYCIGDTGIASLCSSPHLSCAVKRSVGPPFFVLAGFWLSFCVDGF